MIFKRSKDVPSTPKINKTIALPESRSSTPQLVSPPRRSTTPMNITRSGSTAPSAGRTSLERRGIYTPVAEPSNLSGYFSEGGRAPRSSERKSVRVNTVPMKLEDGPTRPSIRRSSESSSNSSSYGGSYMSPPTMAAFVPPIMGERSRSSSKASETKVLPIVTPRPRRPSLVDDVAPRPRKPSIDEHHERSVPSRPSSVQPHERSIPIRPASAQPRSDNCCKPNSSPAMETPIKMRSRTISYSQPLAKERVMNMHWQLLPFDRLRSKNCLHFNIVLPPTSITSCHPVCRPVRPKELDKPAAAGRLTTMTVKCADLPWKVIIDNPDGITCGDVFQGIFDTFDVPLTSTDRKMFSPSLLKQCKKAFAMRCKLVPQLDGYEEGLGMKRVDLLNCRTYFYGLLKPDADGPWLMALGTTPPCSTV